MRKIFIVFFLIFFFLLPLKAFADQNWVINNFKSDIAIQTDGKVHVVETIDVDFYASKHGIFRDIPFRYSKNSGGDLDTDVSHVSVSKNGFDEQFQVYESGAYKRVQIGNPRYTISGPQNYIISYDVAGVLKSFDTYDELYWNVTGNGWDVEIMKASATVSLPTVGITGVTCYEGQRGSKERCVGTSIGKQSASFEASRSLGASEGFTVVVGYTKGLVPLLAITPTSSPFSYSSGSSNVHLLTVHNGIAFGIPLFLGFLFSFWLWYKKGRDFWFNSVPILGKKLQTILKPIGEHETIVVEFEAPEKLRPAEIGVLMDERADTLDVTATIIDLAVRGFLTITEIPKKWLFGKIDYKLSHTEKDTSTLLSFEKELYDRIFSFGDDVQISDLKMEFYEDLKKVKEKLYKDSVSHNLFEQNPETVRRKYLIAAVVVTVLGGGILFFGIFLLIFVSEVFSFGLGAFLSGIVLLITANSMPRRSAFGSELHRRTLGYKMFIESAEKYRQQFFENKNMFNEILPYAIVFGVVEKFAKAFKDIGLAMSTPNWYIGARPFDPYLFGTNINAFSSSFSTSIAATAPKSSGFSSGGGFSGGGFGGGGGGSW